MIIKYLNIKILDAKIHYFVRFFLTGRFFYVNVEVK